LIWVIILLFSLGSLFCIIGLIFYIYFAKKNPDYLRSESFQIKKQSIELLGDKENPNLIGIISIATTNPLIEKPNPTETNEFGQ
jgi:hypothetical protein